MVHKPSHVKQISPIYVCKIGLIQRIMKKQEKLNPILHTAWLNNHALTLKSNTAKYYFCEKSSFLHTFLKFCCESRKI
jgi:hypothetical protein